MRGDRRHDVNKAVSSIRASMSDNNGRAEYYQASFPEPGV